MTGLQHVGDPSPVDVIISPSEFQLVPLGDASPPIKGSVQKSLFPPRIPASWEDEDAAIQRSRPDLVIPGQAAAQLSFPGFKIEPGVKWAPLSMNTSLKLTDVGYAAGLISALLGQTGSVQTFFTLRQQSKPIIVIPEVGSWKIPIWTYYTLNATDLFGGGSGNSTSSFNTTAAFNLTVDSQTVDYETVELPDGDSVMLYLLNATLSFSNPFDGKPHEEVTGSTTPLPVITLANPQLAVACALYHEGVRMARIVVDLPAVATGRNTDAIKVFGRSDVEGTDMLMDWIGKYAEGIDTVVVLGEFEVEYRETRPPLPWVESMIENWRFEVLVPGATEEDSLSAFFVMKKSASH
ncbi:hypothetical protein DFJ73DRAFT_823474 [Zopfochytrium polystomum]|nr:hypothetical protein DFJ73DRAFT_823474 [Zopfochytrium polystomum]